MRKGGGFGLVMLVIVMAIVLYLWAENAREVIPTLETAEHELKEVAGPGELPGVSEMEAATAEHAKELEDALAATNQ